jgi:hypothetical protein
MARRIRPKSGAPPPEGNRDWQDLEIAARQELARRHPDSLLDWTLAHRSFRGRPMRLIPALAELYEDRHEFVVIQKAAQVGISEFLINTALWAADTAQGDRGNALYVMPTQTQVNDFSQARFDKAIGESDYLSSRLHPPPPQEGGPARVQLKRLGQGYVYSRGADSRKQLTSVDADVVLLDEYDLMGEGVLELAQKRLASSELRWLRVASTPRLPEAGINELFLHSDQRYYFLKCLACGHRQRLEWDQNVDLERAIVVCRRPDCRKALDHWAPGEWEPARPGNDIHGYHLNRLYSPWADLQAMVRASRATTPAALREFHNSDLGETFVPPGGQLSIGDLDACRRDYSDRDAEEGWHEPTDMGVDVGLKLHVVVRTRSDERGRTRLLFAGEIVSFEILDEWMEMYQVRTCVVDALPETRKAREFAQRWKSKVYLAYYGRQEGDHQWAKDGDGVNTVHTDRAQTLDEMFDRFKRGAAELPANARELGGFAQNGVGEYYRQMAALKRIMEQNSQGNWVYRYADEGKPDHYAHAEVYCLLASKTKAATRNRMLAPRWV